MPAQDDAREKHLIALFNLEEPENRVRHGVDALLRVHGLEIEFELKSITISRGGLTTVRDLGRDHIEKWRHKHWIVAVYSGEKLTECLYGSPDDMAPWVEKTWNYIKPDFELALIAPDRLTLDDMFAVVGEKAVYSLADAKTLHKLQMSAAEYRSRMDTEGGYSQAAMLEIFRDRLRYLIERGSTLNNPKVTPAYLVNWARITGDHAATLRTLVTDWLAKQMT